MRALVTGAAGFIGSTLVDRLLADGYAVRGVDCFTDYYDPVIKHANLAAALTHERFELVEAELATADLGPLLQDIDVVFHLAGQPGVRASWGHSFDSYLHHNVLATQRLLEASKGRRIDRFVYSSSSSVYGAAERYPTSEDDLPRPMSPYGVSKLAGEHLCLLYARSFGVPAVALRYFTVYGPRQRPDMAMHRLFVAAMGGPAFPIYGDGSQVRDFTYVDDVVAANVLAATRDLPPGTVCNIAGGTMASLAEVIAIVEGLTGRTVPLDRRPPAPGDPARTGGDTTTARGLLGWSPRVALQDGLARQRTWHGLGA